MFLTLYDQHNNQKMEMAPSDSSTQQKAIQSDNVLSLSFVTYECQTLEVNDYIDFYGERFWITSKYTPKQKSTVEWEYDVKLYGIESLIKRYLVVKLVNGSNETEFAYTATAYDQVALIVQNINAGMGTTDWKVGEVVISEYLVIDYEGIYCDEALKKVAELTGVEYWIDGTTVNVTRCEHGELIPLGYDNGLTSLYTDKADNIKFFTRLFPIGSTRNISYEDYGRSRLQLPNGIDYIDQDVDKFGVIHHFEKNAFADIYPRRIGVISSVRSQEVKGENGKPFTIYYIKDDSLNFNPNDYEIEGLVKIVSFQENSSLAGRDFEVNYNATTKEFEIITQWPYDNDIQLPNAQLPPKVLDEYILWNIKMPNEYYPLAEAEYKKAVDKYMEDKRKDISVYKAHTDYIDIAERELNLTIGQRVRLEHSKYFAEGYRNSRITRITRKVLRPTDMDIEISDVLSKGALDKVNDDISDVNHYTKVALGGLPEIIKSWEATLPTDTNVFSSRKVLKECLSRTNDDTAEGSIRFTKGVRIGGLDAKYAIDEQGKATLAQIHSPNHDGIDRKGYVLEEIENTGQYVIRIHSVEIFGELMVNMLTVSEQRAVIGAEVNTCAGCEISMVEELEDRYRCYYQSKFGQWWMVGDQPECKRMISGGKVSNYYWRLVVAVGSEQIEGEQYFWFDLSKSVALGSGVPAKGDQVANCGHRGSDARRKNYIITSAWGESPYTAIYKGIDDFSIEGKRVKYESAELVEIVSDVFRLTSPDGRTVTPPVQVRADGVWSAQRVPYYYYQQVMHKGFAWLCIDKSTTGTGVEPSPSAHSSWICTSKDYDGELTDVKKLIDGVAAESYANAQRLVAMSSDGILSREEKVTARSMWQQIQLSYTKLVGLATNSGVSYAALTSARNALETLFVTVGLNSDTDWVYPPTGQAGSRMDYDTNLSNWDFEICKLSDDISKGRVDAIEIGGGNLLANSRFDDPAFFGVIEGVASLVNDPKFGRVVQWQRTIGSVNFQTNHSINTKILVGREVTFSVIAKNIESGAWSFGGWGATVNALRSTSTQVPLGDGWYLYHSTFIHPAETATFGLNSITGTWQFYAAMVTLGNKPLVDWSPSTEDTQGQIANAQNAADNAIEDITTQGTRIDSWASDFVVSPPEKMSLKDQHNAAIQEKISIDADAAKYGLTATTAYTQYVSGASAAFATWNKYTQSIPENITIGADYSNIAAYYKFKSGILTAISDKVSKDYSDSIQIGGVNLILKSIVSTKSPAGYAGFIGWWTLRQLLVPGKTYVFSTNIKSAEISTIAVAPVLGSGTGQQVIVPNVPFVANAAHKTIYMTGSNANNIGYVVQLEDGNKVTPWSRCQDDLKAEIDDTKTIFSSQIASLDSKIALKVSQTEFNSLGSRVSVAESSITVNSNNISLKVSKDGIISSINQTPEAVKISADRIILDGNTIARIIESEHITTSMLTVTNGAKIGGFKINGSGLSNDSQRDEGFIEYNYKPANCYAGIGSNVFEPLYGLRTMGRFSNGEYNPYDANFGIFLDVWNGEANKNHAIYIRRGMITGANYPTLRTEEAFPLTIEHEYIACYNSSNISFTLPSPTVAHRGKRYQFKRCKGGQVTVHGTIFKNDVATNTPVGAGVGDVATFQNDGMYWCYSYQGC